MDFNIPSNTQNHLRMNHTFNIILHQFRTQVTKPQANTWTTDRSGRSTVNSKHNQIKNSYISPNYNLQKYHISHEVIPKTVGIVCVFLAEARKISEITNTCLIRFYYRLPSSQKRQRGFTSVTTPPPPPPPPATHTPRCPPTPIHSRPRLKPFMFVALLFLFYLQQPPLILE